KGAVETCSRQWSANSPDCRYSNIDKFNRMPAARMAVCQMMSIVERVRQLVEARSQRHRDDELGALTSISQIRRVLDFDIFGADALRRQLSSASGFELTGNVPKLLRRNRIERT